MIWETRVPPKGRGDKRVSESKSPYQKKAIVSPWGESNQAEGEDIENRRTFIRNDKELRIYGMNALQAVFAKRPEAIRKLYLTENRLGQLQPILAWCVSHKIGYRVVEENDLSKLASSARHEGVVADTVPLPAVSLTQWLESLTDAPMLVLWLDGVGNPHNFGAILRSAAHFGVGAILLPTSSALDLSGAAIRVAEGGAEWVTRVKLDDTQESIDLLHKAGFSMAATVVKGGEDLFASELPKRLVYVLGAEGEGMDKGLVQQCDLSLSIPGTGDVESLNVAAATAVLLAQWHGQQV